MVVKSVAGIGREDKPGIGCAANDVAGYCSMASCHRYQRNDGGSRCEQHLQGNQEGRFRGKCLKQHTEVSHMGGLYSYSSLLHQLYPTINHTPPSTPYWTSPRDVLKPV